VGEQTSKPKLSHKYPENMETRIGKHNYDVWLT